LGRSVVEIFEYPRYAWRQSALRKMEYSISRQR